MTFLSDIPKRAWLLILLSSSFQVLIFPIAGPVSAWRASLAWIALVPFLVALSLSHQNGSKQTLLQAAALGYSCGILWYLGNCSWIYQTMYLYGGLPKPIALGILILFAAYLGLYHALFAIAFNIIQRGRLGLAGALALSPAIWVAVELARARVTGFPWDLLGYSQIDNLALIRLAPFAGVMSISFVIAAVNALIASYFLPRRKHKIWLPAFAVCFALLLAVISSIWTKHGAAYPDQSAIMLQENLEVGAPGKSIRPLAPGEEMQVFSTLSLNPTNLNSRAKQTSPIVLLWPEAPSHFFTSDASFLVSMSRLAERLRSSAIIGSIGIEPTTQDDRGYYEYDSAALFDAQGTYHGHYDKIHLVPWGEYVPFKRLFSFAQKLTEGVGNMDAGSKRTIFTTGGHSYGSFICYESIFGDEVRHFALHGAQVLVNISDDGWYGDTGAPWQHLDMTRMRAIENRRWLLLDTNTGITTSIDPEGRTHAEAPRHTRGAYMFPFAFETGVTFYTRYGDWFGWICVLVSLGAVGFGMLRVRR